MSDEPIVTYTADARRVTIGKTTFVYDLTDAEREALAAGQEPCPR